MRIRADKKTGYKREYIIEKEYKKEDRKEHKKRCSHMVCVVAPLLFHRKYRDTFMCESRTFL